MGEVFLEKFGAFWLKNGQELSLALEARHGPLCFVALLTTEDLQI